MRRETVITWTLQESLLSSPETLSVYSDLGFMVVADILEHHLAMALDAAATKFLFQPVGITDLGFRSALLNESPPGPRGTASPSTPVQFAETEWCPWRRCQLSGEVHDENAYVLGGVAGHAGLFGTARGMYRWLTFLWDVHEGRVTSPWLTVMPDHAALRTTPRPIDRGSSPHRGIDLSWQSHSACKARAELLRELASSATRPACRIPALTLDPGCRCPRHSVS